MGHPTSPGYLMPTQRTRDTLLRDGLVRGIPITHFCDEKRLAAGAAGLFVSVCRAVQHAHQKDHSPRHQAVQRAGDAAPRPRWSRSTSAWPRPRAAVAEDSLQLRPVDRHAAIHERSSGVERPGCDTRLDIYALGVLLWAAGDAVGQERLNGRYDGAADLRGGPPKGSQHAGAVGVRHRLQLGAPADAGTMV